MLASICSTLGAEAFATDGDVTVLPALKRNVENNAISERCLVACLKWGDCIPWEVPFDYVFLSDCVYEKESFLPLIETLKNLSAPEKTVIFMSHELRKREELEFYPLLTEHGFAYTRVASQDLHHRWQSSDIAVWRISYRPQRMLRGSECTSKAA